jgi:hypothetical protein
LTVESAEGRSQVALAADDLLSVTNGSLTQNSTYGDNETAVTWNLDRHDRGVCTLWEKLAALDPKFGRPEEFISWPEKTRWISVFVTLVDYPDFVDHTEKVSGDRRGTGGAVTVKDSGWDLGFIIHSKLFFPNQSESVDVFWAYGLRGIAPPWGVTVLDLPGRLPLPAKISIEVLPPIDLREELGGACGDPDKGYELVTGRMQDALRELNEARALPLIG